MKAEEWQRIEELLDEALKLPPVERIEFLDRHCADEADLRLEIESLLACENETELFLQSPAIAFSGGLFDIENEPEDRLIGQILGKYKIVREISRGGMGAVYLGTREQADFTQQVAIKLLRSELNTAEIRRRFQRERQILASLEHPNITRLLDLGSTADDIPFFVMEYVEGTSVNSFCRNLSLEATLKLFVKICETVGFAHRNLVVHRDLKPSNILITTDGTPKLLDFGISKLVIPEEDFGSVPTITNLRAMTPEYASPEQLRGENITTASDVYSLGVILYEILTNHRPFEFKRFNAEEMIRAVCQTNPEKPSVAVTRDDSPTAPQNYQTAPQSLPRNPKLLRGDLDNIVLTALEKEPERRYRTVENFAEDIERHLQKLPIRAQSNTWSYRSHKFIQRHKYGVIAAAFVFLAIASSLAIALRQTKNARLERDAANLERLKTQQINKFLQQMLSFSNQSVASVSPVAAGKNVTVNEMLDKIAPRIEIEFADEPEVRAQVLRTIGSSYASQGFYEKSEKYLRESLEAQQDKEVSADSAATILELGVLLYRRDKLDEASGILEKAVDFYRKQQEIAATEFNPANLAIALDHLAIIKFYQGAPETSVTLFDEAFQLISSPNFPADDHFTHAFIKAEYGFLVFRMGKTERGETLLRQAVEEFRQYSENPRWEFGNTLTLLGKIANTKNNSEDATALLVEGEQIIQQTLGDKNIYMASNIKQQAVALDREGEHKKAEGKARQALEIYKEFFPEKALMYKLETAETKGILGITLINDGRAPEGEIYLRQALSFYEIQPKKDFAAIVKNKIELSDCLRAQKKISQAEATAREAFEEARQNLDERDPLVKIASDNIK